MKPGVYYMTHKEPGSNDMIIKLSRSVNQASQILRATAVLSGSSWIFSEGQGTQAPVVNRPSVPEPWG